MDQKDFYSTLGVSKTASGDEIKKAYRQLARKYHPDVNPGNKQAEARFKAINEAYETLSDPEKRRAYDANGFSWRDAFGGASSSTRARAPFGARNRTATGSTGSTGSGGSYDAADPTGFADFFDALFGNRRSTTSTTNSGPGASTARGRATENVNSSASGTTGTLKGEDVEQPVEITLREAYSGAKRLYTISQPEICLTCSGSGKFGGRTCAVCGGTGAIERERRITVSIPAGVDTGTRVRVAGEGQPGGASKGDLYLKVTVRPDPQFERRGDDLVVEAHAPLTTVVLGGELPVSLIDGKRITLTIPPETQNGRVFRVNSKGMPKLNGGGHGNLLVRVMASLPNHLTEHERELFEELRRLQSAS
jgi:DnaJ-class molecular chaperone